MHDSDLFACSQPCQETPPYLFFLRTFNEKSTILPVCNNGWIVGRKIVINSSLRLFDELVD